MPRFPKAFGRRKLSASGLEHSADEPVADQPSFKVFERPDGGIKSFGGGVKFPKPTSNGQFGRSNTSHLEEDNMFERLGKNRGSGASNTNTASTTDNSSRLSAASTAPSSTDVSGREDGRAHDKKYGDIPLPPIPKSTSGFSLKNAAGRTLSFGRTKNSELPALPIQTSPPTPEEEPSGRARAVTASSYASTATPPKLDERDLGLSLGGDFSDMFSGFGKRKSQTLDAMPNRTLSQSPDTLPSEPAQRPLTTGRINQPAPLHLEKNREVEPSPYSWSSQNSTDGLMSNSTPPPIPQHNSFNKLPQRPGGVADTGLRRSSGLSGKRQSTLEHTDPVDDDARLLRESLNASRRLNEPSQGSRARDSWLNPLTGPNQAEASVNSTWRTGSVETTPRANKTDSKNADGDLFDNHMVESASAALRFQEQPPTPPSRQAPQNKVMTPAQFERYRQDKERLKSLGGLSKADDDEDDEPENYDDDEDQAEKAREAAKQRRKQEAHMSVYRQQMMKVTGETPSSAGPSRASLFATQSSPNLGTPEENEEEDEEIPLAILQAHGFPNKSKQPIPRLGSNPNMRGSVMSTAGGVVDPRLPAFARNLPEDPYVGAGLVNSLQRESMSFGGGAGSVHGGSTRGIPPGGLVGVIATEERSRAMRRGSPNPQGEYGPTPPNGFNGMGMPPSMRPGSMVNGMMPGPMGPMNPMMLTPGDQAQIQMSQQMSQFMQMQMQFMQMMTSGQGAPGQMPGQPNGHMPQQSGNMPASDGAQLRPSSAHLHQRSMTMLEPNAAPWMQQMQASSMFAPSIHTPGGGYTPSIAPSERSNVGLPGRYRPVSHMPAADTKSRLSTMSGALEGWDKHQSVTVRPVKKSENASDEDDDEGWEEMAKKREKKKSKWRMKKDSSNGLKEMLGYTQ